MNRRFVFIIILTILPLLLLMKTLLQYGTFRLFDEGPSGGNAKSSETHKARFVSFSEPDLSPKTPSTHLGRLEKPPGTAPNKATTTRPTFIVNGKETTITASEFRLVEKWIGEITSSTYSIQDSIEHAPERHSGTTTSVTASVHYETVQQSLEGLKTLRGELENAGAQKYNPAALNDLDDTVTKIKQLDSTTDAKSEIIAEAVAAMGKAAANVTETKKTYAGRELANLRLALDDAIRHDADVYIPDQIDDIEQSLEDLIMLMYDEEDYDSVIALGKRLRPSVDFAIVIGAIMNGETHVPEHHPL